MPRSRLVVPLLCAELSVDSGRGADELIAAVASRQHGVVARRQLLALGIGRRSIAHRVAAGRLVALFRGVYAVGHAAVPFRGRVTAALLATDGRRKPAMREARARRGRGHGSPVPGSVASHATAAALWELTKPHSGAIHVTSVNDRARRRGLIVHRAALSHDEVTDAGGIPVTTPARTLLDLAATHDSWTLRRLVKHAEFLHLTDLPLLAAVLARHPARKGRRALAEIVEGGLLGAGRTRNDFEDGFLSLCRRHRLPPPEMNAKLEIAGRTLEIDAVWHEERVAVELDGFGTHGTRAAFEEDRARDRLLTTAGWTPVRITWFQLERRPTALAAELRSILAARRRVRQPALD